MFVKWLSNCHDSKVNIHSFPAQCHAPPPPSAHLLAGKEILVFATWKLNKLCCPSINCVILVLL